MIGPIIGAAVNALTAIGGKLGSDAEQERQEERMRRLSKLRQDLGIVTDDAQKNGLPTYALNDFGRRQELGEQLRQLHANDAQKWLPVVQSLGGLSGAAYDALGGGQQAPAPQQPLQLQSVNPYYDQKAASQAFEAGNQGVNPVDGDPNDPYGIRRGRNVGFGGFRP